MYKITPSDMRHGEQKFFIGEANGSLYYGPNEDQLICPEGLEMIGKLPPITLRDVKEAIKIGIEIGKLKKERQK